MLACGPLTAEQIRLVPLRHLAHLGDAVFHLFERQRQILLASSAKELHRQAASRVSAGHQAKLLAALNELLTEQECEIVRRARNIKPSGYRKSGQNAYRQATAFEALLGYLYLTDQARLEQILNWTAER